MELYLIVMTFSALGAFILFFKDVELAPKITLFLALLAIHSKIYEDLSLIHAWIGLSIVPVVLKRNSASLLIVLGMFAALSVIQFLLFDEVIRSGLYLDWSRKLPPAFAILIVYVYIVWTYMAGRETRIASLVNHVGAFIIVATPVLAILFSNGVIDDKFDIWQNNPNDTSLICTVAWLHILFHHNRSGKPLNSTPVIYGLTFLAIAVTVMASSRWLSIFIVGTFLWWLLKERPIKSSTRTSFNSAKLFFFGTFASILLIATWATFAQFLGGSFLQLNFDPQANGVNITLLWEGFHGYAPLRSSIGYRINGVFAAIGTLVQSWGLGIGVGRAVAVQEMITGYAGRIHVVIAEWMLELGLIFPTLTWFALRKKLREHGIKVFSAPVVTALLSMMAQTTGYITHYFMWFVFVSLIYHYRPYAYGAARMANPVPRRPVASLMQSSARSRSSSQM